MESLTTPVFSKRPVPKKFICIAFWPKLDAVRWVTDDYGVTRGLELQIKSQSAKPKQAKRCLSPPDPQHLGVHRSFLFYICKSLEWLQAALSVPPVTPGIRKIQIKRTSWSFRAPALCRSLTRGLNFKSTPERIYSLCVCVYVYGLPQVWISGCWNGFWSPVWI